MIFDFELAGPAYPPLERWLGQVGAFDRALVEFDAEDGPVGATSIRLHRGTVPMAIAVVRLPGNWRPSSQGRQPGHNLLDQMLASVARHAVRRPMPVELPGGGVIAVGE